MTSKVYTHMLKGADRTAVDEHAAALFGDVGDAPPGRDGTLRAGTVPATPSPNKSDHDAKTLRVGRVTRHWTIPGLPITRR